MGNELEWSRKSDYELHPAGEWKAQFVEWERDQHEKFGTQVKLSFDTEVVDDEGKHRRISTWAKPSLHPKGKVFKLLTAMGINPDDIPDEELKSFTLSDYIGKRIRLTITHEKKKDSDDIGDRVVGFLVYEKAKVKTASFGDEPETAGDKAAVKEAQQEAKPAAKEPVAAGAPGKPDWGID